MPLPAPRLMAWGLDLMTALTSFLSLYLDSRVPNLAPHLAENKRHNPLDTAAPLKEVKGIP